MAERKYADEACSSELAEMVAINFESSREHQNLRFRPGVVKQQARAAAIRLPRYNLSTKLCLKVCFQEPKILVGGSCDLRKNVGGRLVAKFSGLVDRRASSIRQGPKPLH